MRKVAEAPPCKVGTVAAPPAGYVKDNLVRTLKVGSPARRRGEQGGMAALKARMPEQMLLEIKDSLSLQGDL